MDSILDYEYLDERQAYHFMKHDLLFGWRPMRSGIESAFVCFSELEFYNSIEPLQTIFGNVDQRSSK